MSTDFSDINVEVVDAPQSNGTSKKPKPRVSNSTGAPRAIPRVDPEPQPLNREQSVLGIFQMLAMPLTVASPADAAALLYHGPMIAQATAQTAANDPRFAALLDKVLNAGPYSLLLAAIAPLGIQIAANHGLIKPGMMGAIDKDELINIVLSPDTDDNTSDE